jgi:DNA repair exonuclease SbcCD ATPase subunit
MGTRVMAGAALVVTLACAGCSDETERAAGDAKRQAAEALDAAGELAATARDQMVAEMEKRYDQLKPRIDRLRDRARAMSGDARAAMNAQLSALRERQDTFEATLEEIREASGDTWPDLSDTTRTAWVELERAVTRIASEMGDGVAP